MINEILRLAEDMEVLDTQIRDHQREIGDLKAEKLRVTDKVRAMVESWEAADHNGKVPMHANLNCCLRTALRMVSKAMRQPRPKDY